MGVRHLGGENEVVRITSAPESVGQEISRRQSRYVVSMTIRTLCFVAAVLVGPGWLRWVLVAGAFLLPYVAVVMANSASPRLETDSPEAPRGPEQTPPELGTGR